MTGFSNPFKPRGAGYTQALQRIRAWTTAALPSTALQAGEPVISISELACAEPDCPPRETVILLMWLDAAWRLRVHKAMPEVQEGDVRDAMEGREIVG